MEQLVRNCVARASVASVLVAGLAMPWTTPALANDDGNVLIGGFEIDGNFYEGFDNTTTATGPPGDPVDWGSDEIADEVDSVPDVIGGDDESVFDQGAKEDDLESWADSGSAAAPQNGDIGNTWVYDRIDPDTGDQFAYIAFIRSTDTGSVQWYVELNQLPNTTNDNDTAIPDRSVGDLRISIENQGGGDIEVVAIESWDGDSWEDTGVEVPVAINDSEITIEEQTVDEQLFIELAFNLTDIFGEQEDCTFTGFSTLNVRSQSGLGDQSQLKDYATGEVDIPARCGALTIEKQDPDGALLGGASFTIEPNPIPGAADPGSLDITDNDANDADPADGVIAIDPAEPGDYTITEVTPPPGYIQTTEPQDVTIEEFGSATVVFENAQIPSELEIVKVDATTEDPLGGASFVVRLDDGDGVFETDDDVIVDPPGEVTTDGSGTVTVDGLGFGSYWVEETVAPTGYGLPSPPFQGPFTFDADNAGATITVTFEDPQKVTDLSVLKLDQTSEEPLEGATFELYLDDGDGVPEAPGGDTLIDDCTTGGDGTCTVTGLLFGDYYWFETVAPPGYDLPDDPYSVIITINAANAGNEIEPISFFDPRRPGTLTVLKVDDTDDALLAGAEFDLVLDDGDGVYEADEDEVVGNCVTNETGTCSVGDLDFGTYFWVETAPPTGYELPDNPVSDPIVIDAVNVDAEPSPVEFRDPRLPSELSVLKLDEADSTLAGAEFDLVLDDGDGTYEAGEDTVVGGCATAADGTCSIGDLDFGTYFWVETAAPTGYDLPDDPVSDPITIDASNAGGDISAAVFTDPRILSELTVLKLAEDTEDPLAGATFELYLDDGDGVGDAPDEGDVLIDECSTGEDGTCAIGDLDFGDYYWYETEAPDGYVIPEDATSDIITITAANAGTAMEPVTFHDPPVDKPKPPPPPTPDPPAPEPPAPDLPATGLSVSPWALGLAAAVLITTGGGLLASAKLRRVRGPGLPND